jgi:hypothetical protein
LLFHEPPLPCLFFLHNLSSQSPICLFLPSYLAFNQVSKLVSFYVILIVDISLGVLVLNLKSKDFV